MSLREADKFVKEGDYQAALNAIAQARKLDPSNPYAIAYEERVRTLLRPQQQNSGTELAAKDPASGALITPYLEQISKLAIQQEQTSAAASSMNQQDASEQKREEEERLKQEELRRAAIASKITSLLTRAEQYAAREDFSRALDEIACALLLGPENENAHALEHRVRSVQEETSKRNEEERSRKSQEEERERQHRLKAERERIQREQEERKRREEESRRLAQKQKVVRKERHENVTEERTKHQGRVQVMSPLSRILLAVGIPVVLVALAMAYLLLGAGSMGSAPAINSPVVNKPVASKKPEPTVTKTESEQTAPQVLPDSQTSSNVNGLLLPKQVPPDAKPAAVSGTGASEGISLPVTGASAPSTKTANAGPEVRPSIEPSKTSTEFRPSPPPNPNVVELVQQREPEASDLQTPSLAKLEVKSTTPTGNSGKEAPAPIMYSEHKPEIIRLANPKFPAAAWNAGIEGEVVVKVQIGPDGKPIQAKIVKSSSELFNDAVIDAALNSQYSPGMMPTGPVTTWLQMPFTFKRKAN